MAEPRSYMQTFMLKVKRGGKMRKKGAKGAPTAANFKRAKQTARKKIMTKLCPRGKGGSEEKI